VLTHYLHTLQEWKQRYSPATPEEELEARYVEACLMLPWVEYRLDILLTGSPEERASLVADILKGERFPALERRMNEEEGRHEHHSPTP
jgi:ERCC4-type nuclease